MQSWQPHSIDELIEELLTFMELASWRPLSAGKTRHLTMKAFPEAEPVISEEVLNTLRDDQQARLIRSDVAPDTVPGLFDMTTITSRQPDEEEPRVHFSVQRLRRVSFAELRGRARPVSSMNVRQSFAVVRRDGTYVSGESYIGYLPAQQRWVNITSNIAIPYGAFNEETHNRACVSCGFLLDRYERWRVVMAYEDGPSLSLVTDPTGAQEVFRFRDLPAGQSRRTALRHWVKEHWRGHRQDPDLEVLVRKHLRGETRFTWHGLRVEIKVSPADQQKAAQLTDARQAEGRAMREREPSV
jgi:hypothetical protein